MKRHISSSFMLLCAALVFGPVCNAQSSSAASARFLFVDHNFGNDAQEGLKTTYAIELGLSHQLGRSFSLVLPLKLGVSDVGLVDNLRVTAVDLLGRYAPLGGKYKVNPYLQAGYGLVWEREGENQKQIPLGFGLDFELGRNLSLNVQAEYRISDVDGRNNAIFGLGYVYRFRGGGAGDRDGDGVIDRDDMCPNEMGAADTYGCPDNDGDGVINDQDRCPFIPGPRELLGCPDSDKDGVPNIDDKCPTVPGQVSAAGCPDRDQDGIVDDEDKCPDEVGPRKFNGCPDRDNDGVPDNRDQCPDQAGVKILKGCPDTDDDGVPDDLDKCPNLPGSLLTGCPDGDGDGFEDNVDDCPGVAGPNRGCPEVSPELQALLERATNRITFEGRSATLSAQSLPVLDELADNLRANPSFKLTIEGHTDNVGTVENKERLSETRALSCRGYLVSKDIDGGRIKVIGYADSRPKADNGTSIGRELNNRVELSLTPY